MNEIIFKAKIDLFDSLKVELKDIINNVYREYCRLNNLNYKYHIILDFYRHNDFVYVGARNAFSEEGYSVAIPIKWFYDLAGAKSKLEEELKRKEEEDKIREEAARIARAKSLEETERLLYEKLKSKYETN